MAEVTFFYLSLHCLRSAPPEENLQRGLVRMQCVLRALENSNDAQACDPRIAIVHSRCQLPQTKLSKNRPAKAVDPSVLRLSLAVLMDRGQAREMQRTWPLATFYVDLGLRLTDGEGGNYTEAAEPCKGAAKDSASQGSRPTNTEDASGRIPATEKSARGAATTQIIRFRPTLASGLSRDRQNMRPRPEPTAATKSYLLPGAGFFTLMMSSPLAVSTSTGVVLASRYSCGTSPGSI